jgi:hypothetical protein
LRRCTRRLAGYVFIVAVDVNVIDPVIVVVHVHVNAPVDVIDAVDDTELWSASSRSRQSASGSALPRAHSWASTSSLWKLSMQLASTPAAVGCVVDGVDHDHGVVPVHVHGLDHGSDHGYGHVNGSV